MKTCTCCGQTLPDDTIPRGVCLPPKLRVLFARIKRAGTHGVDAPTLFEHLYGERPDGGPESGHRILYVYVSQANKLLRKANLVIRKTCTLGNYVLMSTADKWPTARALLNPVMIDQIRRDSASCRQIASQTGISRETVSRIKRGLRR